MGDCTNESKCQQQTFLATIAHELRTPLNGIIGLSDALCKSEQDKARSKHLKMIYSCANRLTGLVNMITDITAYREGKVNLALSDDVNLNEICEEVHELMMNAVDGNGRKIRKESVQLLLELDPCLPHLRADKERLTQVVSNLVNNALNFTSEGFVKLATTFVNGCVLLCCSDSGIGIKKENFKKIFEAFGQEEEGKGGGLGLGLAIVTKILRLHGGSIWVESELGHGAQFWVSIPLTTSHGALLEQLNSRHPVIPQPEVIADALGEIVTMLDGLDKKLSVSPKPSTGSLDILRIIGELTTEVEAISSSLDKAAGSYGTANPGEVRRMADQVKTLKAELVRKDKAAENGPTQSAALQELIAMQHQCRALNREVQGCRRTIAELEGTNAKLLEDNHTLARDMREANSVIDRYASANRQPTALSTTTRPTSDVLCATDGPLQTGDPSASRSSVLGQLRINGVSHGNRLAEWARQQGFDHETLK